MFITHFLLKIIERDDTETVKVVSCAKTNVRPSQSKMVKFGKKIKKYSLQDQGFTGIKWKEYKDAWNHQQPYGNGNTIKGYKYQSPFFRDYNRKGKIDDEIIIYAKPDKLTVYIFYTKHKMDFYYGVTDGSFTFNPNKAICIYTKEIESLEQVPLLIDLCFVNGSKNVNKYRRNFSLSPIPTSIFHFAPRIFSSKFNVEYFGQIKNEFIFPYTGINKKELLSTWMKFKNGIPRQIPEREIRYVQPQERNDNREYDSDEEPLDVRQARIRRNRAIEAAIEAANFDYDNIVSMDTLPEPDENGYINFVGLDTDNYDIMHPERLFRGYRIDDTGYPNYYAINGRFSLFNPNSEVNVSVGQYAFYWCPTDRTFGIRYKKEVVRNRDREEDRVGLGSGEDRVGGQGNEREPAPMVNKYIYLDVLNPGFLGEMRPQTIDFYSKSYYHLGRLRYDETNIERKDQIAISMSDLETIWNNRTQN